MSGRYDERDLFYVFGRTENVGHEHVRPPTLHPPTAEELTQDALVYAEWVAEVNAAEQAWHDGACCGSNRRHPDCWKCPLTNKGCYDHPIGEEEARRIWEVVSEVTGEMSPWQRAAAYEQFVAGLDSLSDVLVDTNTGDEPCQSKS